MKQYSYTKAVLLFGAFFFLENGGVAVAQCPLGIYCGSHTNIIQRYYSHDYPTFTAPHFTPRGAFGYQQCFDTGVYVTCFPYPPPGYR